MPARISSGLLAQPAQIPGLLSGMKPALQQRTAANTVGQIGQAPAGGLLAMGGQQPPRRDWGMGLQVLGATLRDVADPQGQNLALLQQTQGPAMEARRAEQEAARQRAERELEAQRIGITDPRELALFRMDPEQWAQLTGNNLENQYFEMGDQLVGAMGGEDPRTLFTRDQTYAEREAARANQASEGFRGQEVEISRGQLGVAQGNLGLSRQRLAMDAAQGPEREIRNDANGIPRYVDTGEPVFAAPETGGPTSFRFGAEAMARAALNLPTLQNANSQLDDLYNRGVRFTGGDGPVSAARNTIVTAQSGVPVTGDLGARVWGTDERDSLVRASSAYEAALLPILSGAAVTPSEAQRQIRAALPQVGDSDATLRAKADHRRLMASMLQAGVTGQPIDLTELMQSAATVESLLNPGAAPSAPGNNALTPEEQRELEELRREFPQ